MSVGSALALNVLMGNHQGMVDVFATFFYEPGVVTICFAINALLALVGTIIVTM